MKGNPEMADAMCKALGMSEDRIKKAKKGLQEKGLIDENGQMTGKGAQLAKAKGITQNE